MFNTVKLDRKCSKCGADLEWQSKSLILDDLYWLDNALRIYEVTDRLTGEVHTYCDKCKTWHELCIEKGKIIEDSKEMKKLMAELELKEGQTVTVLKSSLERLLKEAKNKKTTE